MVPLPESRKLLEWDDRAEGEAVQYSFILIFALVIILGFTIAGVSQYAQSGEISQGMMPGQDYPFNLYNFTAIDPLAGDPRIVTYGTLSGFQVSDADVVDYVPYPTDEDPFMFVDDKGDRKYIHIVRNNSEYDPDSTDLWKMYSDFIAIRRHVDAYFLGSDWDNAAIPFTTIEDCFSLNGTHGTMGNVSIVQFALSERQDNMFFNASTGPGEYNFTMDLWGNDFRMFYGWSLFRMDDVDFWNAISMLIYEDIPYFDDTIDFLVHAFIISTITYVIFTMAIKVADLFPFT